MHSRHLLQTGLERAVETVELATPVDVPQQPAPGASSLLGADLKPAQVKPGVFSRAAHMREVAKQQLANVPGGARYVADGCAVVPHSLVHSHRLPAQ